MLWDDSVKAYIYKGKQGEEEETAACIFFYNVI